MCSTVQTANEAMKLAIQLDNDKRYTEAYSSYITALEHYFEILRLETSESNRRVLSLKIVEYLNRVEQLKRTQSPISVKLSDVAGLHGVKRELEASVIMPIRLPQLFVGKRKPCSGILLYGPGGTGKSLIVEALANEIEGVAFFPISSSDIVSKYQGESERAIKDLFVRARKSVPSIIFIDEIDSMCTKRTDNDADSVRRIKTEFMVQMQGDITNQPLVIAATNLPWDIDSAMMRRFQKKVYVPLPDRESRRALFRIHSGSDIDFCELAEATEGYSGSDINTLVNDALFEPLRFFMRANHFRLNEDDKWEPCHAGDIGAVPKRMEDFEGPEVSTLDVVEDDFWVALDRCSKSVSMTDVAKYDSWIKSLN